MISSRSIASDSARRKSRSPRIFAFHAGDRVAGRPARPREVRRDQVVAAARGVPAQHVEAALAAPARVLGVVGEAEVPGLHAHPAGGDVERDEVRPADLELHPVHVRQLPARLVHGEVEGVPLQDDGRVVAVLAQHPRPQVRVLGVLPLADVAVQGAGRGHAQRREFRREEGRVGQVGVVARAVVRRRVEHLVAVRGDEVAEQAVWGFEAEAEDGLAHALEGGHLGPVEHPPRRQAAGDRGVGHLALPPVRDVVGGEGRTVRPAVSLPQREGPRAAAVVSLHRLRHVRHHRLAQRAPADRGRVAQPAAHRRADVALAARDPQPRPAVSPRARPVDAAEHERPARQPLRERREHAVLDQRRQERRLLGGGRHVLVRREQRDRAGEVEGLRQPTHRPLRRRGGRDRLQPTAQRPAGRDDEHDRRDGGQDELEEEAADGKVAKP